MLDSVKKLVAGYAPADCYVFLREGAAEILIVREGRGVIYTCKLLPSGQWQVLKWALGPGANPEMVWVHGSQWELTTSLTNEMLNLKVCQP